VRNAARAFPVARGAFRCCVSFDRKGLWRCKSTKEQDSQKHRKKASWTGQGAGISSSPINALTNAQCATPGRVQANGSLKGSLVGLLGVNCVDASGHRRFCEAIGLPRVNRQFHGCRSLTRGVW